MEKQKHHFFASTAFGWATATTRQGAIDKVAKQAGAALIKRQVKAHNGLYVWTCRVDAPVDATYDIEFYKPVGVVCGYGMEHMIVAANGKVAIND